MVAVMVLMVIIAIVCDGTTDWDSGDGGVGDAGISRSPSYKGNSVLSI